MNFYVLDQVVDCIRGDHGLYAEALSSSEGKFNQNTSDADSCFCDKCGQSTVIGKPLDCCLEAIGNKSIFCSNKVHMDSRVILQHGDVPEETADATMYLVENSKDDMVCSHEKSLTVPDSIDSGMSTVSIHTIVLYSPMLLKLYCNHYQQQPISIAA